jgi:hypothetical protein
MADMKPKIMKIEEAVCENCIYSQAQSCLCVEGLGFEEGAFCDQGCWLSKNIYAEGEVCVANIVEVYNHFSNEE